MNKSKWHLVQVYYPCVDFEKELIDFPDQGNTSLDLRLTFILDEHRTTYLSLAWRNDDGNSIDAGDRAIDWDVGLKILGDTPLPKELLQTLPVGEATDSNFGDFEANGGEM